ncbi:MAG TPA: TolC family protein [bacterium]|nr:TolC family protein [bacterium]
MSVRRVIVAGGLLLALALPYPATAQAEFPDPETLDAPEAAMEASIPPPGLPGEVEPSGPVALSLADAILYARIYNFGLAAAQVGAAIDAIEPEVQEGIFDPTLRAAASYNVRRRGGISFQSQISGGSRSETGLVEVEAIKPTRTGGQWSLGYSADRNESSSSFSGGDGEDDINATYSSNTEIRYTQPLLEGFGRRRTRSPITQAEINAAISAARVQQQTLTLEQTVTQQYLAILRARRQLDVAETSLGVAQAILEQTEAQVEAGALARFEVTNARGGLATREEGVLLATQRVENATDQLKQTLGLPLETEIVLTDELNVASVEGLAEDEALGVALGTRPEVEILDLQAEAARDQLENARENLQNDLNLNASAGLSGEGLEYGESLQEMDKFSWSLGLEYLIPLGTDHRAEGQYRQAQLALDRIALERQETLTAITTDVSLAVRNLAAAARRLEITGTGVAVAEERLENERARLNLGLSTTTLVLEVEEDLADAQLRRIEAELDFAQAKADLLQALGFSQLQAPPAPVSVPPLPPPPPPVTTPDASESEGAHP